MTIKKEIQIRIEAGQKLELKNTPINAVITRVNPGGQSISQPYTTCQIKIDDEYMTISESLLKKLFTGVNINAES